MGRYWRLLWRLGLVLAAYQFARLAFYFNNAVQYPTGPDLWLSFLYGLRFDLSALVILNLAWILGALCGLLERWPRPFRHLFVIVNSSFIFLNLGDAEYFQFTGSRLTTNSFAIGQDLWQQMSSVLLSYWFVPAAAIALGMILFHLYGGEDRFESDRKLPRLSSLLAGTVVFLLAFTAGRGGIQAKPLNVGHAYLHLHPRYAALTLNSTFTILKSYGQSALGRMEHYASWQELHKDLPHQGTNQQYDRQTNVVMIVLESFGREYMGYEHPWAGYTPFLDELASRSVFFKRGFANGRRSIDSLPSLLAGIPSLMVQPFATSRYQTSTINGLPAILQSHGYKTAFFHGGHDGTMFFDVLASRLGFQSYFGADGYPDQSQDDGRWGIFDEPFLQYTAELLSQMKQPFMATIFTLSSHHPYRVPDEYRTEFAGGTLPIHPSIRYADFALKKFFDQAAKSDWFDNTLFVITADHTSTGETPDYQQNLGRFRVPLLFYHPKRNPRLGDSDVAAQHIDVLPTILSLLGIEGETFARFGQSLVDHVRRPIVLFEHPFFWTVWGDYVMVTTEKMEAFEYYNWSTDPSFTTSADVDDETRQAMLKQLTLTRQYFQNGLIENKLNW